jgi:metal-responsive CopG/Arc/MetJ family transcriptional regulator
MKEYYPVGMSGEPQIRACVSLPRETLRRVDRLAAQLALSRSATVDAALRYVLSYRIIDAAKPESEPRHA